MRYATVNPANTSDIGVVDLNNRQMRDGDTVRIPDFAGGERTFAINNGAVPEWHLWEMVESAVQCGKYTDTVRSYAFDGARVTETVTCPLRTSQQIYDERVGELANLTDAVRQQGVEINLPSNGRQAMRSSPPALDEYAMTAQNTLPGATTARSVDVFGRWYTYALSDMPTVHTQMWLHLVTVAATAENHQDQLNTLLAADDAQGLADYDIGTGWPEPPTPPP